ncbi:MAG: (p)ppGpp synthetase [Chloroflexi bacterium]|nr:(p)ppGpp synthetase [Chloroflexota bacterium]
MITDNLYNKLNSYLPVEEMIKIKTAFKFANKAHRGQKRKSGHDFIVHPVEVAYHLARLELEPNVIVAGLLHDVIEDTNTTNKEIEKKFGIEVSKLVSSLTKLNITEDNIDEHVEKKNLRNFLVSMAEDVRVAIIKLADRLHNVETLQYLDKEKRQKIAKETLSIHAPIADKIGMNDFKWRLEDESFKYLMPNEFKLTSKLIKQKREEREIATKRMISQIEERLSTENISVSVSGRPKHLFSVHNKLQRYKQLGRNFSDIEDLIAIRIVVKNTKDCYLVLGVIHELWRPVTGSFDDYISSPKDNLYQSLHTVVINDQGQKIEFQIRTDAMHLYAEDGMASHWKYKNTLHDNNKDLYHDINWTQNLLEWETEIVEDSEYLESVNNDILSDKVIVNSPKNEVFTLPIGSTPLDYAYRLHTDLGHSCQAAFVNGVLVPLNKKLNNGDTVQIQKSDLDNGPSLDWLNENLGFIATANARNKVKSWFKKRERTENIKRGKDQILSNIRLSNIETSEININDFIDKDSFETFAYKVGTGEVNNEEIINLINQQQAQETVKKINSKSKNNEEKYDPISSIVVMGGKDFQNKIANCCEPVYGDEIVGYKLSSNEVIIHRIMCSQLRNRENTNRFLVAAWGHSKQLTPTKVMIEAYDRMGLIRDITDVVWGEKTNLHSINSSEDNQNGTCKIQLTVYTRDLGQIIRLLGKMEKTPGVYKVSRIE